MNKDARTPEDTKPVQPTSVAVVDHCPAPSYALPVEWYQAEQGIIPADLAVCAHLMNLCNRFAQRTSSVRWMTIAKARDTFPVGPVGSPPWLDWVQENYPQYGNRDNIHTICRVGAFLITWGSHKDKSGAPLRSGDFQKLLALLPLVSKPEYLERRLLQYLLTRNDIASLTRDRVREIVDGYLRWDETGPQPEDAAPPPKARRVHRKKPVAVYVVGDLLAADTDERKLVDLASDPTTAHTTAVSALVLLDVAVRKYACLDSPERLGYLAYILGKVEKQEMVLREMLSGSCRRLVDPHASVPPLPSPLANTDTVTATERGLFRESCASHNRNASASPAMPLPGLGAGRPG